MRYKIMYKITHAQNQILIQFSNLRYGNLFQFSSLFAFTPNKYSCEKFE